MKAFIEKHDRESLLCCNHCHSRGLECTAYRTACNHLLCQTCAYDAFSTNCFCPVCTRKLRDGDVAEIVIGVPPIAVSDIMFQSAFQKPNWETIVENTLSVMMTSMELTYFVQMQLMHEATSHTEQRDDLIKKIEQTRAETSKLTIQLRNEVNVATQRIRELEHTVRRKETELQDLKEAYKQKMAKCDAWEKAYNSATNGKSVSTFGSMLDGMHKHAEPRFPPHQQSMSNIFPLNSRNVGTTTTTTSHNSSVFRRMSTSSAINLPTEELRWIPPENDIPPPATPNYNDQRSKRSNLQGFMHQPPLPPSMKAVTKSFFDKK